MYSLDNPIQKRILWSGKTDSKKVLGDVQLEYSCELKYDGASKVLLTKMESLHKQLLVEMDIKAMMLRIILKQYAPFPLKGIIQRNLILGRDHFAIRWFRKMNQELIEIGRLLF
jgi:DNA ligase (NAD+)